jgi:hypothetical protein
MAKVLLDAATATGSGERVRMNRKPSQHTLQATMGGTVVATAVTVDTEGSLDELTWFQIDQHVFSAGEITAEGAMWHITGTPVKFLRANLTTLTGGTAPTVTVKHVWSEV